MTQHTVLHRAAALAAEYLAGLPTRSVAPTPAALARLHSLDRPFPDGPADPTAVLEELHAVGSPATMATAGGFVTGATMANFTALAAARQAVLRRAGWDVEADGLFGAPPIGVVVGEEV